MTTATSLIIPQNVKSLHVTPNPTLNYLHKRIEGIFTHKKVSIGISLKISRKQKKQKSLTTEQIKNMNNPMKYDLAIKMKFFYMIQKSTLRMFAKKESQTHII